MRSIVGFLLLVGLVVAYWQWVLAAVVVVLIVKTAPVAWADFKSEQAVERQRLRGLVARADQQHLWAMSSDPRGTHGEYPSAFEGNRLA